MKIKILTALLFVVLFSVGANAQQDFAGRSLASIKSDYRMVAMVARVKIKNIMLAATDIHKLYRVESEVVEPFKGNLKKGAAFTFYFSAEDDYNVQPLVEKDWVVFLEKEGAVPGGGKGWYELENSLAPASEKVSAELRKLKKSAKKG